MPSIRVNKELNEGTYFLTFTVKNWYYIFDRHNRFQILSNSIQYCQKNKDLKLYAYFVRDFKKFTSKEIQKNIIATEPSILKLFQVQNRGTEPAYEFWQKTNMPKLIESEKYFFQKANYIHENPMRKQYVANPEYWLWSSANPQSVIKTEVIET
jgi:REP element-mobilizing transposase RayT